MNTAQHTRGAAQLSSFLAGSVVRAVVYHGARTVFDCFDLRKLNSSVRNPSAQLGFAFAACPEEAAVFTSPEFFKFNEGRGLSPKTIAPGALLIPAYLSLKNPFEMDWQLFAEFAFGKRTTKREVRLFREHLVSSGHDGIYIPVTRTAINGGAIGGKQSPYYTVFTPNQIKSAISNGGQFDSSSPMLCA